MYVKLLISAFGCWESFYTVLFVRVFLFLHPILPFIAHFFYTKWNNFFFHSFGSISLMNQNKSLSLMCWLHFHLLLDAHFCFTVLCFCFILNKLVVHIFWLLNVIISLEDIFFYVRSLFIRCLFHFNFVFYSLSFRIFLFHFDHLKAKQKRRHNTYQLVCKI